MRLRVELDMQCPPNITYHFRSRCSNGEIENSLCFWLKM